MLIRKPADLRHSDVTPKQFYLNRRRFLAAGSAIAGAWALPTPAGAITKIDNVKKSSYTVNEKITSKADITSYNNYYEFGTLSSFMVAPAGVGSAHAPAIAEPAARNRRRLR